MEAVIIDWITLWVKYFFHSFMIYFLFNRIDIYIDSVVKVTERLATDLDIRTEWIVKSINYSSSNDNIIITSSTGKTIEASRVVVAVPLPVLKDGDIEFI